MQNKTICFSKGGVLNGKQARKRGPLYLLQLYLYKACTVQLKCSLVAPRPDIQHLVSTISSCVIVEQRVGLVLSLCEQ